MKSSTLARWKLVGGAVLVGVTTFVTVVPADAVVYCRSGYYVKGCVRRPPAAAPAVRCGHVGYTRGCVVR